MTRNCSRVVDEEATLNAPGSRAALTGTARQVVVSRDRSALAIGHFEVGCIHSAQHRVGHPPLGGSPASQRGRRALRRMPLTAPCRTLRAARPPGPSLTFGMTEFL